MSLSVQQATEKYRNLSVEPEMLMMTWALWMCLWQGHFSHRGRRQRLSLWDTPASGHHAALLLSHNLISDVLLETFQHNPQGLTHTLKMLTQPHIKKGKIYKLLENMLNRFLNEIWADLQFLFVLNKNTRLVPSLPVLPTPLSLHSVLGAALARC